MHAKDGKPLEIGGDRAVGQRVVVEGGYVDKAEHPVPAMLGSARGSEKERISMRR